MPPNVSQVTKKIDLPSNRIIDLVNNAEIIKWLQIFKLDMLSCITNLENKGTINLDESHESLFNTKKRQISDVRNYMFDKSKGIRHGDIRSN